ncbi:MAG: RidA family protein [Acidimicrobiales bacterium]|nr:RidA family protein [Acidimicrobiales bacterium]
MNRPLAPASIAPTAARYAHGVLSSAGAELLHTAGVVPIRPDGTVPDGIAEQAATVWQNIDAIVRDAGMQRTDIVSVTTYVVPGQDMAAVMAARSDYLGDHLAASTLLIVAALARPEWKVETAVVAARAR